MRWRAVTIGLLLLLSLLTALIAVPDVAMADTQVRMAGAGLSEAPGTLNWANPGRITANDNSDANPGRIRDADSTERLRSTNHGFSVPSGASIDGIEVEVEERDPEGSFECQDIEAKLTKAGSPVGADRFSNPWPEVRTVIVRGGATDLWGTTWTPADVNNAGFGFALRADNTAGGTCEARVDFVRITVYYTPGVNCQALTVTPSDPAGSLWFNETVEPDGIPFTNQVNVSASFQTGAVPALSVRNDGTGACDITLRMMSDPGVGRSLKFNTTNSAPWPADTSREVPLDPSSVTVCTAVASGGSCDIWLWGDFENALAGQTVADVRVESV